MIKLQNTVFWFLSDYKSQVEVNRQGVKDEPPEKKRANDSCNNWDTRRSYKKKISFA